MAARTNGEKLITPAFLTGWVANFLQFLIFYFLITTMALYAVKQFGVSDAMGGFAASSFIIGATAARIFSGFIVDRFGRRRIMLIAVIAIAIACAFYNPADSFAALVIVRLIHGMAYAVAGTAIMAMVQEAIPAGRRSEGTGYLSLGTTLAAALGPAVALLLIGSYSYEMLFWLTAGVSVVALLAAVALYFSSSDPDMGEVRFSFAAVLNPKVLPIATFMLIIAFAYSGVMTYINTYAEQRDVLTGAGFFFISYAVTMFIFRPFLGRLQDRRGDDPVINLGLAGFIISLIILATAQQDWQVILAGAFSGLGYGTLMPAAQSVALKVVDRREFGSALSTFFLLVDIGFGLGPIILGVVISAAGFAVLYWGLAGCVVLAGVFYMLTHGRRIS